MNPKQRTALWIGIVLFVMVGINPPWKVVATNSPLGFSPIYHSPREQQEGVDIDMSRLIVMWIITAAITGGLIATAQDKSRGAPEKHAAPAPEKHAAPAPEKHAAPAPEKHADSARTPAQDGLVFHFPERGVGDVLVESDDDPDYLNFFAEARGKVTVPRHKKIQLEMRKGEKIDLSFLSSLGNKEARSAIYSIDLSQCKFDDATLRNLTWLPQLEELDLSGSTVSDMFTEHLIHVPQLKKIWLDETEITSQSAAALGKLDHLNKLSLVGAKIAEEEIKLLRDKHPECDIVFEEGNT
ncbi:MAG TPA: hypothetical protein V6D17_02355 [Candidatus Obscuribacterales bacterium]